MIKDTLKCLQQMEALQCSLHARGSAEVGRGPQVAHSGHELCANHGHQLRMIHPPHHTK